MIPTPYSNNCPSPSPFDKCANLILKGAIIALFVLTVTKCKPYVPVVQYKYSGTHRSAEVDNPASLAVLVPFREWWVHATSRVVEGSHDSLGT